MSDHPITKEEAEALQQKLRDDREQRIWDAQTDEVLNMVKYRKPMILLRAEAQAMPECRGFSGIILQPKRRSASSKKILKAAAKAVAENWVFLYALVFSIIGAALVM